MFTKNISLKVQIGLRAICIGFVFTFIPVFFEANNQIFRIAPFLKEFIWGISAMPWTLVEYFFLTDSGALIFDDILPESFVMFSSAIGIVMLMLITALLYFIVGFWIGFLIEVFTGRSAMPETFFTTYTTRFVTMLHHNMQRIMVFLAIGIIIVVVFFVVKSSLTHRYLYGTATYQADNQVLLNINTMEQFAILSQEPPPQLIIRNWSDNACDVRIASSKGVVRSTLTPGGTAGSEKSLVIENDRYVYFTMCGKEQRFYSEYDNVLTHTNEYPEYKKTRQKLLDHIADGDTTSDAFIALYDTFGEDFPFLPYLYAFHYEVLFGENVVSREPNYIEQGEFDVAINQKAKDIYHILSWTALTYQQTQSLLADPTIMRLFQNVF